MRLNVRTRNNYKYYTIIKDYTTLDGKRTTKTFEKLGNQKQVEERFGKNDTLNKIKEYINGLNLESKEELICKEFNPNKKINYNNKKRFNIGYLFLDKIYNDLNIKSICNYIEDKYKFEFDLNEILSYLVFARIIYPSSKLETFKQCQNFIKAPIFKLHDEYRALNYLASNIDYIQEKIYENSKKVLKRNSKVIYYDCTNYFFEINTEDDLRRYGVSKEHRPNPIVSMGLFMDGDGIPLSFNIYSGNKSEQETMIPEESKIINNFKLDDSKVIICTDAGLASDDIKNYNTKDGRGFVITQSLKKFKNEYKEQVFNKKEWRLPGDLTHLYNLDEINEDEILRDKYYDCLFYKIIQTETKSVKQDTIVSFSFKYYDYNQNVRNSQIERAQKNINSNNVSRKGKNQNDPNRFIREIKTTETGEIASEANYMINQELIDEEAKYDGLYAVSTNLIGNVEDILKITKGRWEIEESFRIMKSDFLARPINLSREDRIRAHFITCYIALLIYRILEKKLEYKYTTTEILKTIKNMEMLEHKGLGYEPLYERTKLTDNLHNVFCFNTDYEIISYKKMKKIFNTISN